MEHRVEYLPLSAVKPAKKNPKLHDAAALEASMARFGFTEPLLLDERTGRLVAGHGRLEQLRKLQAQQAQPPEGVRVSLTDPRGPVWMVPVTRGWESKDDAEAEAYLLAANQLTIAGGWNLTELGRMLEELGKQASVESLGWTPQQMDQLISAIHDTEMDPADAWKGMPEFKQDDKDPFRQIIVSFASQEDVDAFAKLLGQTFTEKTKSTWYPEQAWMDTESKRYG